MRRWRVLFVLLTVVTVDACFADLDSFSGGGGDGGASEVTDGSRASDGSSVGDAGDTSNLPDGSGGPPQTASPYVRAVLDDLPLAYWRLGESPGATIAADRTGAHAGTYVGASTQGLLGALANDPDTAVRFTTGRVEIDPSVDVAGGQFTVEMWLDAESFGVGGNYDERYMVGKWDTDAGTGFHVYVYKSYVRDGGTLPSSLAFDLCNVNVCTTAAAPFALPAPTFHHVVFVRDVSQQAIYLDGVQVTMNQTAISVGPTPFALRLGASYFGNDVSFPGTLDEIALYDHALSAARIQAHFAAAR